MPNWCECRLMIVGQNDDLEKLLVRAGLRKEEPEFSLSRLYPEPDYEKNPELVRKQAQETDLDKEVGWYEWRIANWGVKWNPTDVTIIDEGDLSPLHWPTASAAGFRWIEIRFSSPWCSPEIGLKAIFAEERRLGLFLFYYEPGMDFEGELRIVAGEVDYAHIRSARPQWEYMTEDTFEKLNTVLNQETEEE